MFNGSSRGFHPPHAARLRAVYAAERVLALLLLILLLPLILLLAGVIAALSKRSPFILHARVGQAGAGFRMLKFRTMWGAAQNVEYFPETKAARDPRVTSRIAALCRRFSLDELPQLLHVAS